ncbi:glycosyltransferase [Clostridium botulinum]|uniref:glycosyltransferase n=1 Tax=Clostridium botulinum TaxID=1491 RepID=UPI0019689464|nr:glycosyltransferase [Clostridium botulinum]MBN1066205.1 glycosyltransferase [Clostridium botulinum]
MCKPTISIIMSIYNETFEELNKSINSILSQTFKDFEFIIINDNPNNIIIKSVIDSIIDPRIKLYNNEKNCGLIFSLNKAIQISQGKYIARMDADDISYSTRLEEQLNYIQKNNLDLIGSYIELINEEDETIKSEMRFPIGHKKIDRFMTWGSCIAHPTWLGKRSMFEHLGGYRNAKYCEDYDLILRAIKCGYVVGNLPKVQLKYRIRMNGISKSHSVDQYLIREYLSYHRKSICIISDNDINNYLKSNQYMSQKDKVIQYKKCKSIIKNSKESILIRSKAIVKSIINKYFWKDLQEKIMLFLREY